MGRLTALLHLDAMKATPVWPPAAGFLHARSPDTELDLEDMAQGIVQVIRTNDM
jgi:hypothetical protein